MMDKRKSILAAARGEPEPGESAMHESAEPPGSDAAEDAAEERGAEMEPGTEDGDEEEQANVQLEEQALYDKIVTAALDILFNPKTGGVKAVVEKLTGETENIAYAIGHTAASVMLSVRNAVEQGGEPYDEEMFLQAGQEIVGQIVDIAEAANLLGDRDREEVSKEAMLAGVQVWGKAEQDAGMISPERRAQAKADFDEMRGAAPPAKGGSIVEAAKGGA